MASFDLGQYPGSSRIQISPSRQPTLESQNNPVNHTQHRWRWLWPSLHTSDDFEQLVGQQFNLHNDKALTDLIYDYRRLKGRPGARISRCLAWYKAFGPFAPCPLDVWLESNVLEFSDDGTFSLCIQQLKAAIEAAPSNHLQLCALAAQPDEKVLVWTFSFSQKLFASCERRLERLNDVARRSIALLVTMQWSLPEAVSQNLTHTRCTRELSWELNLPSSKQLSDDSFDLSCPKETKISLMWQSEAPRYEGDFNVYIWQQYRTQPEFEYADIFLLSSTKLILSFRSSRLLHDFASLRLDESILGTPSDPCHPWSPTSELLLSVFTVYKQMIRGTGIFLQESQREINAMKLEGRRAPSASKIRYLVHLEDCRSSAAQGVTLGLSSLAALSAAISTFQNMSWVWDAGIPFLQRVESIEKDLVYLNRELSLSETKIDELQKMLHDHLNLAQGQRLFLLTVVAALYIPLSFLSGFFGMNISNPVPQDFSSLSQSANDSLADLSISAFNQTAAVLTALNSSGSRTWDLKYYWIFTVPFLFTIPLFLLTGSLVRLCIRSAARYAVYWRIATIFLAPIICVGFYWALPYYTYAGRIVFVVITIIIYFTLTFWSVRNFSRSRRLSFKILGLALLVFVAAIVALFLRLIGPFALPIVILVPWAVLLGRWIVRDWFTIRNFNTRWLSGRLVGGR